MPTHNNPAALRGGKSVNITESTHSTATAAQTGHTNPRTRHHAGVPILGNTAGPPSPESIGWKLPRYGSRDFWRYLLHAGISLREFARTPLYDRAVNSGLIVANRWRGPADFTGSVTLPPVGTAPKYAHKRGPDEQFIPPAAR